MTQLYHLCIMLNKKTGNIEKIIDAIDTTIVDNIEIGYYNNKDNFALIATYDKGEWHYQMIQ